MIVGTNTPRGLCPNPRARTASLREVSDIPRVNAAILALREDARGDSDGSCHSQFRNADVPGGLCACRDGLLCRSACVSERGTDNSCSGQSSEPLHAEPASRRRGYAVADANCHFRTAPLDSSDPGSCLDCQLKPSRITAFGWAWFARYAGRSPDQGDIGISGPCVACDAPPDTRPPAVRSTGRWFVRLMRDRFVRGSQPWSARILARPACQAWQKHF